MSYYTRMMNTLTLLLAVVAVLVSFVSLLVSVLALAHRTQFTVDTAVPHDIGVAADAFLPQAADFH